MKTTCDECEKEAKHFVRDARHTGFDVGKDGNGGNGYLTYEPGPLRRYCDDHVRKPVKV